MHRHHVFWFTGLSCPEPKVSSSGWEGTLDVCRCSVGLIIWSGCGLRISVWIGWGFDCSWWWGRRLLNPAKSWFIKVSIERVCSVSTRETSRSSRAWLCSRCLSSHMFCVCCILSKKCWYCVCSAVQHGLFSLNMSETQKEKTHI